MNTRTIKMNYNNKTYTIFFSRTASIEPMTIFFFITTNKYLNVKLLDIQKRIKKP